jgi:ADP-heptose:LPS heptosyltransferase
MHAAAALGKPVVGIFGPTEPRRTGPYGRMEHVLQDRSIPCVPCMKSTCRWTPRLACLDAISPATVLQHIESLLRL